MTTMAGRVTIPNRLITRRLGNRAVTAIEFALLAPVILVLIAIVAELGVQSAVGAALDYGAQRAGRLGITGALVPNGPVASDSDREAAIRQVILSATGGLLVNSRLTLTQSSFGSIASAATGSGAVLGPGGSGQVVRYEVTYTQPLIVGSLSEAIIHRTQFTHTSTVLVVNEPFPAK